MGAVLLSETPIVLSLRLPKTSTYSLTPSMASPMSWDFKPIVPHPCSLVKGPRTLDRSLNTDINRRIVWNQSSHCWVAASVRIGELVLCIGRLFRYVILLWVACSSSSPWRSSYAFAVLQSVPVLLSLFLGPFLALPSSLLSRSVGLLEQGQ